MAYIKPEFIDELLDKVDIKDIVTDYTELKKKGSSWFGLSPFETEKTPSFNVNDVKQRFKCYSSGKSGNAITFLMEQNMTYIEAIETIAGKYGIEVQYADAKRAEEFKKVEQKKQELRPLLNEALAAFQKEFVKQGIFHPAKQQIYNYRKYSQDVVLDWQIGFAPGERFIANTLGYPKEARELGLIGEKGFDKYWNRVIYPIHDIRGLLIGFGGRDLSGDKKAAKWINSSDSLLYKKETVWYGLDRALKSISKTGEAWIVEGYDDVIAWHRYGLTNTVASCGTSITDKQIAILRRYTSRIIFCFDADKAGKKSMLRYIPVFLAAGFRVDVVTLPSFQNETSDPDEFSREFLPSIKKYGLPHLMDEANIKRDSFKILMNVYLQGTDVDFSKGAQQLCKILSTIEDEALVEIYLAWLQKESKLTKTVLKAWVKKATQKAIDDAAAAEEKKNKRSIRDDYDDGEFNYNLPDSVTTPFKDLKQDIYKYSLFMSGNKIYMMSKPDSNDQYSFYPVTNFSVQIIQHMNDEKMAMKLLKIKNIHNLEKIFDVPSEQLNTPQMFDNAVTAHGNYLWTGGRNEFQKLRAYLFDKMGTGRKIDVLGWQQEGFWAWNNAVTLPNGNNITLDDNGIFLHEKTSYYIPSANKIYKQNPFKYDPQKRFKVQQASVTFKNYVAKAMLVHRNHAISGVLFAIASAFQDIVVDELGNFPIFYMYGPASTGKDQLAEIIQSMYGVPQTPINLEGGASTLKAKVLELAQFCNSISHFSEYKRGDPSVDGILKGFWDRVGYKRGNIVSHIGVESIPILCSVILTGNDYPDAEALITRLLWNEMTKNTFNEEAVAHFEELRDMTKGGLSSYVNDLLKYRDTFKEKFQQKYRMFKEGFGEKMPDAKSRMISNVSILGATYEIFKEILDFPFTFTEMQNHFISSTEKQMRKLHSASVINKWWDCYLAAIKAPRESRLMINVDFKLEGTLLFFNPTSTYNSIQLQWWKQYHESIPGKSTMLDSLKKDRAFVEAKKSEWIAPGYNTSVHVVNIKQLSVFEELRNAIEYQLSEGTIFEKPKSPATPVENEIPKQEQGGTLFPIMPEEENYEND